MSFEQKKLKHVLADKGYIRGPFGSALKRSELKSEGFPVYEQQHAIYNTREFRFYVDEKKLSELNRFIVKQDDLIISCSGTVGKLSIISKNDPLGIISQALLLLRTNLKVIRPVFLYYFLSSNIGYYQLVNASHGSVQLNIAKRDTVESIMLPVPEIATQDAIVKILKALDDKIELNKKINQTLESIAQAMFKSWFVDFDPVHAKANAKSVDEYDAIAKELGISREILDLFPCEFEESELGLIPSGWEPTKIENYITILDSKRVPLSKNEREKRRGKIPYYGATSVMDYVNDFLFDEPLTLIGEDGSVVRENGTPFAQYIWGKSWINNHAHVLKAKRNLSTEGIYILFKDTNVSSYVTGAVQPKINQNNLKRIPILDTNNDLYGLYSNIIAPLFSMIRVRSDEIQSLSNIRDSLLPKLLSGEIDVSNLNLEPGND